MAIAEDIKQIFDFDVFGGLSTDGNLKTLQAKEAFINSLIMWLLNKEGDFLRDPEKGGFLYNWLTKPMSDFNSKRMAISLQTGIEQEYIPRIVVKRLEVIPIYEQRKWTIILEGFVPEINEYIDFQQDFRSLV